jgi:hypothetical protein
MAIAVAFPDKTFSFDGRNSPTSELNTMRPSLTIIGLKTISTNATEMRRLRANIDEYNKRNTKRNTKDDQAENVRESQSFTAVDGSDGEYDLQSLPQPYAQSDKRTNHTRIPIHQAHRRGK